MALKLYRLRGCPYCIRVEDYLDREGIAYEKVEVSPWDRSAVVALSGQQAVPVLVDEEADRVIADSSRILEYLQSR